MTRQLTLKRLVTLSLVTAAVILPTANPSDLHAQGIRLGSSGRLSLPGQASNFQSSRSSVGNQVQGIVQGVTSRNLNAVQGRRRGPTTLPVTPTVQPVTNPHCQTNPRPAPPRPAPPRPFTPVHPVSQPTGAVQPTVEPTEEEQAREHVLAARRAFEKQDYPAALRRMDEAVKLVPGNRDARQFRSLILFATPSYQQAAAEAYDAVLLGPVWNWETLRTLYKEPKTYTQQFRRLQQAAASQPESLDVHFLLAYHYLMLGHLKHGEASLVKVLEIQPEEPVTQQLLHAVRAAQDTPEAQTARK
jgi:tetratricopeptide (TPR) repeat protein